jgi:hypothetical protein
MFQVIYAFIDIDFGADLGEMESIGDGLDVATSTGKNIRRLLWSWCRIAKFAKAALCEKDSLQQEFVLIPWYRRLSSSRHRMNRVDKIDTIESIHTSSSTLPSPSL